MERYYKDFKSERTHDYKLIALIKLLAEHNKEEIFRDTLLGKGFPSLGKFINGTTKRDFDVWLEFENFNIIIETKVDSAEGNGGEHWQTEHIFNVYNEKWKDEDNVFLYMTYGLSEFYIKKCENGNFTNGPYSSNFKHIKCEDILLFINEALKAISNPDESLITWSKWLGFEAQKRKDNQSYINDLANIIERYKSTLPLTDYPVNRMNLFTPEFTVPFYYRLCDEWNRKNNAIIGKASFYPIGRMYSSVSDSIINFSELWDEKDALTCNGLLGDTFLYFELNEDFNLHLKASGEIPDIETVKQFIWNNSNRLKVKNLISTVEDYSQGAYVLYEWDLHLLKNDIATNINNIEQVLLNAISVLK